MRFKLEIELGNDAMQTPMDVAMALTSLADRLTASPPTEGVIRDENGNPVGRWSFEDEEPDRCDHKWRRWPEFPDDIESCRDCGKTRARGVA